MLAKKERGEPAGIVSREGVMSGTPCVAGTRIPAETIVAYLKDGYTDRDIFEDYPSLPVDGIDAVAGATTHHEGEASTNRLMAQQASTVVVAADSSKVGRRAFARIFTAREVDVLVTDAGISADDKARLEEAGVDVVVV